LKQFNQVITVEVSVDSIAQKLLESMNVDFKHAELVTEAVIGSALHSGKLSYIYNALNGFTNDINFKVGDKVRTTKKAYMYKTPSSKERSSSEYATMDNCVVLEIDEYRDAKLLLEYDHYNRDETIVRKQEWVSHTECSQIEPSIDLRKSNGAEIMGPQYTMED